MGLGAESAAFEYFDGDRYVGRPMRSVVTVNNTDAYRAACNAGLGLIQVPCTGVKRLFAEGSLVEVLPAHTCEPMPVSIVHAYERNVPKRVRAVMSWIAPCATRSPSKKRWRTWTPICKSRKIRRANGWPGNAARGTIL